MTKYLKTAHFSALEKASGGLFSLLPDALLKLGSLIPLLFLWRAVMSSGARTDMTLPQILSYTAASAILADLLVVRTPASGWLSEGMLLKLYGRPLSVLGQLAALTAGSWLPMLLLFSLPMALLSPLLGFSLIPSSLLFWPSLLLCVSLGFALDVLFVCLSIRLRNMSWLVSRVRAAIVAVFSGTVFPISLLPFGLADAMRYQPFASLGGAPLSVLVGAADAGETVALQGLWNLLLWPLALLVFQRSQERVVSYGG